MEKNVRPHRAHMVDDILESEIIHRIDWPDRFPELNPMENIWDALRKATATRNSPFENHLWPENSIERD